ncbi:GumC family protein [Rhodopila sp.]|uniref:GumC family protein n=1 Tax=Rhodopila sp. TaxID=2480087 RepID=UPI003D0B73E5
MRTAAPKPSSSSVLTILARRKTAIILVGLITASLAFGISRLLPPQFSSEGRLMVEGRAVDPSSSVAGPSSAAITQIDVLESIGLLRKVNAKYDLVHMPGLHPENPVGTWIAGHVEKAKNVLRSLLGTTPMIPDNTQRTLDYVRKHLLVKANDNSNVISVRFTAGDPQVAARVVNAVMGTYLETLEAARHAQMLGVDQFVDRNMIAARRQVDDAEAKLAAFVAGHPVLDQQGNSSATIQLSTDSAQLAKATEELAYNQVALETIRAGNLGDAQEVLNSKVIQSLKELQARTEQQISALSENDPRRRALQQSVAGLKLQINREASAIMASLKRNYQAAKAKVGLLQTTVQRDIDSNQATIVAASRYRQLAEDVGGKRQVYIAFLTRADQMRVAAMQGSTAYILFAAVPPTLRDHAFGIVSLVLGFLGGAGVMTGILTVRHTTSTRVNSSTDLADFPVFGSLPELKFKNGLMVGTPQVMSQITETFRALWLAVASKDSGSTILVTSSEAGEGKSTIAIEFARRLANDDFRVLLIDGDMRRPRLSSAFDLLSDHTLETLLEGQSTFEQARVRVQPGLDCLIAKGGAANPLKLASSPQLEALVADAKKNYDFVVIDAPPVLHVAEPTVLSRLCERIILVVEAGRVRTEFVDEAVSRFLPEDQAKLMLLLTRVRPIYLSKVDAYSGYAVAS